MGMIPQIIDNLRKREEKNQTNTKSEKKFKELIGDIHKWCPNFWDIFWPPPSPLSEFYLLALYYLSPNFMDPPPFP